MLVHKEIQFWHQERLNFADISIFGIGPAFFGKTTTFTQSNSISVTDSLVLFSVFLRQKITLNENWNFADHASGMLLIPNQEFFGFGSSVRIRLLECSKSAIYCKSDNNITYDVINTIFFV